MLKKRINDKAYELFANFKAKNITKKKWICLYHEISAVDLNNIYLD